MSTHDIARLEWRGADSLPTELHQGLCGPGAPFEIGTVEIRGADQQVFVNQPPNLRAMFDRTVMGNPDGLFMVDGDREWTFSDALRSIDAVGRHLRDVYGIGRGDRVAFVSANSSDYLIAMWAVLGLGAIVTSFNGWWTSLEIASGIELTSPRLILGDDRRLERVEPSMVPSGVSVLTLEGLVRDASTVQDDASGSRPVIDVHPDDPAVILFTSGTTGRSKGATLSHRNIVNFAWVNMFTGAIGAMTGASPAPVRPPATLVVSPMFHVSGLVASLVSGPALGVRLVFPPPGRWDPVRHLELTEQHGLSVWSGVPTQFWRLLAEIESGDWDTSTVFSVGGGGAPFPPELVRELNRVMPQAVLGNGYGMSETMGLGTMARGPLMVEHPDSVGVAMPTVTVEVRDEHGTVLGEGEVGEIHLRTGGVFIGYWNDDEATAAAIHDGWYRTGDFGRIEGGLLYLESRMRDLILRGGENIYPVEIENRLVAHPDIRDAAVIGVDHPELGQEVKAFVVVRDGATLTADDVRAWVGEALARYKVPAHVEFRDELPYTETGKLMKRVLEDDEKARRSG